MKIVRLTAENIKRLVAVEIAPDGNVVQITGKNGAGKTSVLDSIWWALAGAGNIQAVPIRKGQEKARIRLDMGEIVVERRFSQKGSTLTVESADGSQFKSPQKMLDDLLGSLSFDPLAFARMEAREQYETIRKVSRIALDIDALDAENARDFDARTEVNRDAKRLQAQAAGITIPDDPGPEIDAAELVSKLDGAGKSNAELEQRRARRAAAETEAASLLAVEKREAAESGDLLRRAKEAQERAEVAAGKAKELRQKLDASPPLPDPIDTSALSAAITSANATNAAVARFRRAKEDKVRLSRELKDAEADAAALTKAMEARETRKRDAIASAELPVDGLGLESGRVLLNGLPFDQASDAEKLRVSLAIAVAANPKLRVIRIRDGSLLDESGMAAVAKMAEERDYQVWIERVDTSGKLGILIEDGMVAGSEVDDRE